MQKQIGAILLVAGTCIGSGMIALPIVLSKIGLVPSILLMLVIWGVMYYSSLISLEINLKAGKGLALGELGQLFSGSVAKWIGSISLALLCYALLSVFLYGGASIFQKLLIDSSLSFSQLVLTYASVTFCVLILPVRMVDYCNRILFMLMIAVIVCLIVGLGSMIDYSDLPLFSARANEFSAWRLLIPVVFTSFGFQVIFHIMTDFCDKNVHMLRQAFFWGSLIPAVVYIIWTACVLSVVHHENPQFYHLMLRGDTDIGDLIEVLSAVAKWPAVQALIWWTSSLAILTSVVGVGLGLCASLQKALRPLIVSNNLRNLSASLLTVLPAYIIARVVPSAFTSVLGFAGIILAIIAILLPTYLLYKVGVSKPYYRELKRKYLLVICVGLGALVILCESMNILL